MEVVHNLCKGLLPQERGLTPGRLCRAMSRQLNETRSIVMGVSALWRGRGVFEPSWGLNLQWVDTSEGNRPFMRGIPIRTGMEDSLPGYILPSHDSLDGRKWVSYTNVMSKETRKLRGTGPSPRWYSWSRDSMSLNSQGSQEIEN